MLYFHTFLRAMILIVRVAGGPCPLLNVVRAAVTAPRFKQIQAGREWGNEACLAYLARPVGPDETSRRGRRR
jgi:hypothetical protein